MKSLTAVRSRNWLFNLMLFFVSFSFVLVWLPLLRCLFDGASYRWGQTFFGVPIASQGIQPGILFLLASLVLYLALFYAFYWSANRKLFYGLLGAWWLISWGNFLFDILKEGDAMFHGDTLNVHISVASIIIPIALLALVGTIFTIRKDRKMPDVSIPWNRRNRLMALLLLAPLPVQIILLISGEPHGTTDEIGVIITILQAILFPLIFIPKQQG
ncbi:MAG: ubiquinol cytochrome C oxidoreductase [Saprospiraceae bacterium]|nr:ubiquinol cytochrome C oxidoreductase [Saprospiraceae bacterium]